MNLAKYLKKIPHYRTISKIARSRRTGIWLVGGFLRDAYLAANRKFCDFDFCVERNVLQVVKDFTKLTRSKFITLDEEQASYRVIIKAPSVTYTYDFTLMRGKDFHDDLSLRDFTINMLAVSLMARPEKLIDCFGTQKDLNSGLIRSVREEVFTQDPLRILRGFSFMSNYGFAIEKTTEKWMVKHKELLKKVSGERLGEELFKIFAADASYKAIKRMSDYKIIDEFIPYVSQARGVTQGSYHHLDVWGHSLEALREFEILCHTQLGKHKDICRYLDEEITAGKKRIQVMKLACLLHDIGKPVAKKKKGKRTIFYTHEKIGSEMVEEIAFALRLSFRAQSLLKKIIFWHLRPGYLADQETPTHRAIYRFFRDTGEEGASVILVSLADWRATRGVLTDSVKRRRHECIMLSLVDEYFRKLKEKPLKKILDGYDIMDKFNLEPSPFIGKALKKIKEEQALGRVLNKSDAYKVVKNLLKKVPKNLAQAKTNEN
ncbi:MAG: HD domain-containing protein [Candidatus Omnitrophica bacterium]|nr:HD domain-containing protein [Candidatus Omnitrophota bacterium]